MKTNFKPDKLFCNENDFKEIISFHKEQKEAALRDFNSLDNTSIPNVLIMQERESINFEIAIIQDQINIFEEKRKAMLN